MRRINTIIIYLFIITISFSCGDKKEKLPDEIRLKLNNLKVTIDTTKKDVTNKDTAIHIGELKLFRERNDKRLKFYGFKDVQGNIVIPLKFKYAERFKNNLAKVFDGSHWGFINKEGNYVVEPKFDYLSHLENNFSLINKDGLWGYLDKNFKLIINPEFSAASPFKNNKAMVHVNKDTLAQIDTLGNINELFCQFPDTLNNSFKNLPYYKISKILKPSESYGTLRKYIKEHLEMENYDIYFLRQSSRDGEGSNSIVFQNLKYGIKFYGYYGWEHSTEYLRVPGITFDDGVNLAIQIVGHHLKSFTIKEDKVKLDMGFETGNYIIVEKNDKGFIQLVEVESS